MKNNPCSNCGAIKDFKLVKDIGYDINGDGEERQHLQRCNCGYWRMVLDIFPFGRNSFRYYCRWRPPSALDEF